jgi:uncharacterized membrane protein YoaT (DUF817 family)
MSLLPLFSRPAWYAPLWQSLRAFEAGLGRTAASQGRLVQWGYEFLRFGIKQAWGCLFGALLLALIILTKFAYPHHAPLPRYDALFIAALVIQAIMLLCRFETPAEARIILVFHIIGMIMEIFKTSIGAWAYPEPSLLRIGGVPLFTGFMYAAIGSYLMRIWGLLKFQFRAHPPLWALCVLSVAIYVNFFTHHYLPDIRLLLMAATVALFGRCFIYYRPWRTYRRMPLLLGFVLVAVFIWFAENIGTFMGVWRYPAQRAAWHIVPVTKLEAWLLLMIVSYTLVALSRRPRVFVRPS